MSKKAPRYYIPTRPYFSEVTAGVDLCLFELRVVLYLFELRVELCLFELRVELCMLELRILIK